jgi:recombinational DNA repair ATPase RecF
MDHKEKIMPQLIAKEFRIRNFRNIDDSGWIELDRVTALVGRNESGKTALLSRRSRNQKGSFES